MGSLILRSPYPEVSPLLTGLGAYWPLHETSGTRADSLGTAPLAVVSTVGSGWGLSAGAASFTAAGILSTPNSAAVQLGNGGWTISCWVRPTTTGTQVFLAKYGSTAEFYLGLIGGAYTFNTVNASGSEVSLAWGSAAVAGRWAHVTIWWDPATTTAGLQVDGGTPRTLTIAAGYHAQTAASFTVGGWELSGSFRYAGLVAEIGLWHRALTAAERTTLRAGGRGLGYPFNAAAGPGYHLINATDSGGQALQILEPTTYSYDGLALPAIMMHHGAGMTQTALTDGAVPADVPQTLNTAGYLLACSYEHNTNWGNNAALADITALYSYLTAHYSLSRVVAWSISMGGLAGLLSAAAAAVPLKGWLGTFPVANLANMYAGSYQPDIQTAYGIDATHPYATQTAGHDPVLLAGSAFSGLRMRAYASPDDALVNKTANSDQLATLVTGYATEMTVVVCSGPHGDVSHYQASDYLAFFNRCV